MRRTRGSYEANDDELSNSESPIEGEENVDHIDVENNDYSEEERPRKRSRLEGRGFDLADENKDDIQSDQIVGPILYEPGEQLPDVFAHIGALLEVHVLAKELSLKNPQVVQKVLWGHHRYTADSDVVAMLHHSGHFTLRDDPPADLFGVRVFFRIGEGLPEYKGATEYGLSSQSWHSHYKISLSVESVVTMKEPTPATLRLQQRRALKLSKSTADSTPGATEASGPAATSAANNGDQAPRPLLSAEESRKFQLVNMSLFPSTILVYNLSNEPSYPTTCFVYELALVCDRGAEPEKWTSYKLKHAVLYLETLTERYELSCEERPPGCSAAYDTYRWAKVLKPYETDRAALEKMIVPLEAPKLAEVLDTGLDWSDLVWDNSGVTINKTNYKLMRMFWFPRTRPVNIPKSTSKPSPTSSSSGFAPNSFSTLNSTSLSVSSSNGAQVRTSMRAKK